MYRLRNGGHFVSASMCYGNRKLPVVWILSTRGEGHGLTAVPSRVTGQGATSRALHWRHHDNDGVSNHQHHGCLLKRLFRRRSQKTSTLRVTGLCVGNSPGPVNSPHKGPVTRKMFPFDGVIMKFPKQRKLAHCSDVIMSAMASLITGISIVYSIICSGTDHRKHQSSEPPAFVRGIHRWRVNSLHKEPVTRKCFHLMTSLCCHRVMDIYYKLTLCYYKVSL